MARPLLVANCSGFYGDRLSAAYEMVTGGAIDVLTGDWLAELTMLILQKGRARDPEAGYARTFVTQMEQVMGLCLERGIKVVANAGGLAPDSCAAAVRVVADRLGLNPSIAYVLGDDLLPRLPALRELGVDFPHLDTGVALGEREVVTANAYLGGWGIATALNQDADIVITGRVTDAALLVGPAAWHHGWAKDSWDALAGAVVAGHVIECGAQATGGNYSFFADVLDPVHPGFPIAEVADDGSSVITKHPGHAGMVSVGTVTAQLLYEIGPPRYLNPDVTARFDTISLSDEGSDRVRISGVRGEPPPSSTKVAMNYHGGFRSTTTLYLTGLDIPAKAELFERALWHEVDRNSFSSADVQLLRTDHPDPESNEVATASLRITVKDADERKVGRQFTSKLTELGLSSYPGLFGGPPASAQAYGVYWPALVPAELVPQTVVVDGRTTVIEPLLGAAPVAVSAAVSPSDWPRPTGPTRRAPIGTVAGARSGDKGGNANLGVWALSKAGYRWVAEQLTVARVRELLPDLAEFPIERYELPNLLAVNFVVVGLLGEGVASSTRLDGQAKSLGEYLRAKVIDVPEELLDAAR